MDLQNYKDGSVSIKIPRDTHGYVTPESFHSENINKITAKKQDYFALGATIFLLKFGNQMLKYNKNEKNKMTEELCIDLLIRDLDRIRTDTLIFLIFYIN